MLKKVSPPLWENPVILNVYLFVRLFSEICLVGVTCPSKYKYVRRSEGPQVKCQVKFQFAKIRLKFSESNFE